MHHLHAAPAKGNKDVAHAGTGVPGCCGMPSMCWQSNLGPLDEPVF